MNDHDTLSTGPDDSLPIAVVGAHLGGMPLNHELTGPGGRLIRAIRTAPLYRLFELPGTVPAKPGLLRVGPEAGMSIAIELWSLPAAAFGQFVARIPGPLGIGTLILEDGSEAKGFLVEEIATREARDISHHGGWRAWIAAKSLTAPAA